MRHRIRVLKARTLAWVGYTALLVSMVRGRVDEVWVGDSNAVLSGSDRFPRFTIGSTERGRWVWALGPRLMFSLARDGFPPTMYRMLRLLGRVQRDPDVLWIFSAGEIDLRAHLTPRLASGHDLEFVKSYVERVRSLVNELHAPYAAISVPFPAAEEIADEYPVAGSLAERAAAHRIMRERIIEEMGSPTGGQGAVIIALDATDRLSDVDGHFRPELTYDGIHLNERGREEMRAATTELRVGIQQRA